MTYMISWFEPPQDSAAEHENVQKRILEVLGHLWVFAKQGEECLAVWRAMLDLAENPA